MTREKSIPWLIELAGIDPAALASGRPGDLPNLLFDFNRWLGLDSDSPLKRQVENLERAPAKAVNVLRPIIRDLSTMLAAVADGQRFELHYSSGIAVLDASRLGSGGPRAIIFRDANLRAAIMRLAFFDMCESARDAARIRRCRENGCRQIFFARRHSQTYCSHACANKVASRSYREKNRALRAARERARYAKKIQSRAPNLRITRHSAPPSPVP